MKYNELRGTLREKKKEIEKLQSGTSTSTVCTVYSNMLIYSHCISNMKK